MLGQFDNRAVKDFTVKIARPQSAIGGSLAWAHFGDLYCGTEPAAEGMHFCMPCLEDAKRSNSEMKFCKAGVQRYKTTVSTSNHTAHLKNKHPDLILASTTSGKQADGNIKSFLVAGEPSRKRPKSESDKKYLHARQLVLLACRDLLPFSFVEGEGFTNYALVRGIVNIAEELPSEKTLRT